MLYASRVFISLLLPSVAQAGPSSEALTATLAGQWCPTQQQLHVDLQFGYELARVQGPEAVSPTRWPLSYSAFIGLGTFGAGGTHCSAIGCSEQSVVNPATRPPAWRIERSVEATTLAEELTVSIPALEKDPSFGDDSTWRFQLSFSEVKTDKGCHALKTQWIQPPAAP